MAPRSVDGNRSAVLARRAAGISANRASSQVQSFRIVSKCSCTQRIASVICRPSSGTGKHRSPEIVDESGDDVIVGDDGRAARQEPPAEKKKEQQVCRPSPHKRVVTAASALPGTDSPVDGPDGRQMAQRLLGQILPGGIFAVENKDAPDMAGRTSPIIAQPVS